MGQSRSTCESRQSSVVSPRLASPRISTERIGTSSSTVRELRELRVRTIKQSLSPTTYPPPTHHLPTAYHHQILNAGSPASKPASQPCMSHMLPCAPCSMLHAPCTMHHARRPFPYQIICPTSASRLPGPIRLPSEQGGHCAPVRQTRTQHTRLSLVIHHPSSGIQHPAFSLSFILISARKSYLHLYLSRHKTHPALTGTYSVPAGAVHLESVRRSRGHFFPF